MPFPYALETIPENRSLLVRAELMLTPTSQACLIQSAMAIQDKFPDSDSESVVIDELGNYFYTHAFGLQRKQVRYVITPTFTEDLSIPPLPCFTLLKHLAKSSVGNSGDSSKLILMGQLFRLRATLHSIVPVLWRLQTTMKGFTVHTESTLLALDNELLNFMNTELYPL